MTEDIKTRLAGLQNQCGCYLELLYLSPKSIKAEDVEKQLHRYFAKYRYLGEWFNIDQDLVINKVNSICSNFTTSDKVINKVTKITTLTKEVLLSKEALTSKMKRVGKCLYKDKEGTIYEVYYKNGKWNIEEVTNVGTK